MKALVPNETSTAVDDLPDMTPSVVPVIMTRKKYSDDIETEKNKATLYVSQQRLPTDIGRVSSEDQKRAPSH